MRGNAFLLVSLCFAVALISPASAQKPASMVVEHEGLLLTLPGDWNLNVTPEDDVILLTTREEPGVMVMVFPPAKREGEHAKALERWVLHLAKGRRMDAPTASPRAVKSDSGLKGVYQRRVLEVDGGKAAFHWYLFDDGKSHRFVALLGEATEKTDQVHQRLRPALLSARLDDAVEEEASGQEQAPAAVVGTADPRATPQLAQWPRPGRDDAKKGSVPFKLRSVTPLSVVGPRHLLFARFGTETFYSHTGRDSVVLPPEARGVYRRTSDGRRLVIGDGDVEEVLGFASKRVERTWVDASGTLYAQVTGFRSRVPVAGLVARTSSGEILKVVDLKLLDALGDGTNWGTNATFAVASNGGAWAFVKQGKGHLRGAYLEPVGQGAWRASELTTIQTLAGHAPSDLEHGNADPFGGYVFWSGKGIWRITRDAAPALLARVELPTEEGTLITPPVVTPDGHIWIGMSPTSDVMQWIEPHDATHKRLVTTGSRSGSSGLVRITPDGKGGASLAVVPGRELVAQLAAAGHSEGKRLELRQLQVDPATGDLIAWDAVSETLLQLQVGARAGSTPPARR